VSSWRWLVIASALVACGAAAEMIEKGKSSPRSKPTPVESMARVVDDAPRSVLKCWQEGRLIFESNDMTLPESGSGGVAPMKGPKGRTVQLLDLRQGLCILERTNG
jgi:hypothetical protein